MGAFVVPLAAHSYDLESLDTATGTSSTRGLTTGGLVRGVTLGPDGAVYYVNSGTLMRLPPDGGTPQRITPDGTIVAAASACGDGSLVYQTFKDDHKALWHIGADGSNPRVIVSGGDPLRPNCADGKSLVFTARLRNVVTVRRVPLTGGEPTDVMTNVLAGGAELSPDGTMVAAQVWETNGTASPVHVVPTSGDAPLFSIRLPASGRVFQWSPDGTALRYVATRQGADNIWEQPLKGGAPNSSPRFQTSGSATSPGRATASASL